MARKPPAFQCYASNLIADKYYRLMQPIERAIWVSIYLECWVNEKLPAKPSDLSKWLGISLKDVEEGLTENVMNFFKIENGLIFCPELEDYRTELSIKRVKQSSGGKEGAKRKKEKALLTLQGIPLGSPSGTPLGSLDKTNLDKSNLNKSINNGLSEEHLHWVIDYDTSPDNSNYLNASKGF